MTLWLPLLAFAFGSLLVTAVTYALTAKPANIDDRLRDVLGGNQPRCADEDASSDQIVAFLKRIGERLPKSPKDLGKIQLRLVQAGLPQRRGACRCSSRFASASRSRCSRFCMTPLLIEAEPGDGARRPPAFGYVLPGMLLARKARRRQHRIRLSLADALDLLVVSVEAGLGLDQALARVGQELAFAYPDLSSELRLVNLELLAGKGRSEALRNLADRTGVDDLSSLVAMLVQTDKFGTSVAHSLRVFSETLRTKRRQRAEEAAAKTGVKMVFPLVVCIFPAIWIVTIGPAAIQFMKVLGPMGK